MITFLPQAAPVSTSLEEKAILYALSSDSAGIIYGLVWTENGARVYRLDALKIYKFNELYDTLVASMDALPEVLQLILGTKKP